LTLKIDITTLPHKFQQYKTLGDWTGGDRHRMVFVSEMNHTDYEFLIALHELIEHALCLKRGITDDEVTKFDKEFQGDGEPGDDPKAPYWREHQVASLIESWICEELGLSEEKYNEFLNTFLEKNHYE
jgi:hypothetical protein